MAMKKKQTFIVSYTVNGCLDIDVEAENVEEAIALSRKIMKNKSFELDVIDTNVDMVSTQDGNTVWENEFRDRRYG